jgi:hypothetical protein
MTYLVSLLITVEVYGARNYDISFSTRSRPGNDSAPPGVS